MGKLLKIVFGLGILLTVLIVVAAIVLPMVVDPNDYKDEIAAAVKKQTGRALSIEGDISLSVFPWLGLDIGPTQLSNAAGFEAQTMAQMEAVQIRIKLLPLLRKQLEADKIKLIGLRLNLAKDKQGQTNWADLSADSDPEEQDTSGADASPASQGNVLDNLAIGGIEVTDAQLIWDDRSSDAHYEINALSFTTGAIEPGAAFDLELSFLIAAKQPMIDGQFTLRGEVLIDADLNAISVSNAVLGLDAQGAGVPGDQMTVTLASDIALGLAAQTLLLPDIRLEVLGLQIQGSVTGAGVGGDDPRFNGTLTIADFVPRDVIQQLGMAAPDTADHDVLGLGNTHLAWEASPQHFAATSLSLQLDDSKLAGTAKIESFDAPALSFALVLDQFDLDRYLPKPSVAATAAPGATPAAGSAGGDAPLPLDTLRQLNLNGRLEVGSLTASRMHISDVDIQVRAKDGVLKVKPLAAKLYGGVLQSDVMLNVRTATPHFAVNETLTGVQAGALLKDLTGVERILGTANVSASLKGAGVQSQQVRQTLNGTAQFSITEGAIKGVNIAELIRKAQATLKGQPAPEQAASNQTDFASLVGSMNITDGLVKNEDLSMQSPLLRLTGEGNVNLPDETIDYTLTTKFVGSLEGQGGEGLSNLQGIKIPVHVGGTFSKPSYKPDLAAALSEEAKARVDEEVDKQKEKLKEKLGDKLPANLLDGLFK